MNVFQLTMINAAACNCTAVVDEVAWGPWMVRERAK